MRADIVEAIERGGLVGTRELLDGIQEPTHVLKDVAALYAAALRTDIGETDWPVVNRATIERFSLTGLKRIKKLAWAAVENAVTV